jgi:hypothetical protein
VQIEVEFILDLDWLQVNAAIRDANDSFPLTVYFRRGKGKVTRVVVLGTNKNPVFTVNYKRKGGIVGVDLHWASQKEYKSLRDEGDD